MNIPASLARGVRHFALIVVLSVGGVAMANQRVGTADTIITNARIYTVDKKQPWADSVAIKDGKIVAVGTKAAVAKMKGSVTRVIDLGGKLVLPAFGDVHVHPLFGGLSRSRCPLHDGKSLEAYQALIAKCVAQSPGNGTIYGIGWDDALFPPSGVPRKEVLDAVSTTRPLIFESLGGHTYWLNSKALEVGKITKDTPNPANGSIDRDPQTGEPVGGLQETAMDLVRHLIPAPTPTEVQNSVLYVVQHFNSLGITNWQDAGIEFNDAGDGVMLDAYDVLNNSGKLTAHVTVALKWKNERGLDQFPSLWRAVERAKAVGTPAASVKFYVDGVIPQKTAHMLAPFEGTTERGLIQIPPATLKAAVTAVDARGIHAFIHAIGDGAVHEGLNAVAAARARNGAKGTHHLITHLNVVDPADQPRFGTLNVYAQFQPSWASWYPYMELTATAIGEKRMESIYPAGSIVRAGGKLAYGADWPVGGANPLAGLEVAITRRTAGDAMAKPLIAGEGISLAQAIESYTINVAQASGIDRITGSIARGKSADLVVLDKDIFKLPVYEISKAKVLVTLFRGKAVHGDLGRLTP